MSGIDDLHRLCDQEPIRTPGAIQPHGALLVFSGDLRVTGVSENCAEIFGLAPDAVLGVPLDRIVQGAGRAKLLEAIDRCRRPGGPVEQLVVEVNGRYLDCHLHGVDDEILLDAEPWDPTSDEFRHLIHAAVSGLDDLHQCFDPEVIAGRVARHVQALTGFDRVMVYRFDDEWNGEVIAESRVDAAASYLGLRFPASDIPAQARDLYRLSTVRQIPDAEYVPSPIRTEARDRPIDLGLSALRSVSPYHLEYMRNMGVRASLVGSVLHKGRLWGLIACHQLHAPRPTSGAIRDVLHWVCKEMSALIAIAETHQRADRTAVLESRRGRLLAQVHDLGLAGLMVPDRLDDLLRVVEADGFAFIAPEGIRSVGLAPSPAEVAALHAAILARPSEGAGAFSTCSIRDELGMGPLQCGVSGMVLLPLGGRHGLAIAWFRGEHRHSVSWGGDPAHAVEIDGAGRLSPRKSFDAYLQQIDGRSRPWGPEEIDSACRLKELIDIEVQRNLTLRSSLLHKALTSLNEMVIITEATPIDLPGPRIVMVSDALTRLTGYSAAELIGRTPRIFQGPLTSRKTLDALRASMERWERTQVELVNYTKDGRPFWVEIDIAPIADDTGWFTHWIAVQRDVSRRKRDEADLVAQHDRLKAMTDELLAAREEAGRVSDAKSAFLANMAHELRTPMHAIMSFSKLGLDRTETLDPDRLAKYFGNIRESGERLTNLLNDLVDLSKIEAGRMELNVALADVGQIVQECLSGMQSAIAARALHTEVTVAPGTRPIRIDPVRIGQMLRNLLSNAVRFSPEGGCVRVGLNSVDAPAGQAPSLRLVVEDEGVGIPEDRLGTVFERFVQVAPATSGVGGSGLGLAICREIVAAHGGVIRAVRRPQKGTTFEVLLPGVARGPSSVASGVI
jgi:PAS domain S-box-containing protein